MSEQDSDTIGYRKPPSRTRFTKGQSGNPRGRPKNGYREIPYDAVLGQMVTIREGGRECRVTAAEAFLLQLTQKGLAGDSAAARASLDAIEAARAARGDHSHQVKKLAVSLVANGADAIIGKLGIAKRKYATDEQRVRWELNPWIVEVALERFCDRRLTVEEQREVRANTRTPHRVKWPAWWEMLN